jgi:hypothetical protein
VRADSQGSALPVSWLIAITAATAALRLLHLDVAILGDDEVHLLTVISTRRLGEIPGIVLGTDFSIPMALLFRLWSEWTPLDEWMLRTPTLLAGSATPVLAALLARRYVSTNAALLTALVVAVHPMFVFYARYVRPYALCAALLLLFLWQLDRYAQGARRRALLWAALLGALSCWLQPIAVITTGLAFGGLLAAELWPRPDRARRALPVALAGLLSLALTLALFAPALGSLVQRMVLEKIGADALTWEAVRRNAEVLAGWPALLPACAFLLLALVGAVRVGRRAGRRALLLLAPLFGLPLVIVALSPDSISKYQVLARYVFYVLPLAVLCAAEAVCAGAAWCVRRTSRVPVASAHADSPRADTPRSDTWARGAAVLAAAAWAALGPLSSTYGAHTAYPHHNLYQTFDHLRNEALAAARTRSGAAPAHPYYVTLADAEPPPPLVIEWPPVIDYPNNYYPFYQACHRRPLALYAAAEEPWYVGPRLALAHVMTPERLARGDAPPGALLVMHRNPMVEAAHFVYGVAGWVPPIPNHERFFRDARADASALFGAPVFEDRYLTVFRVPDGG